LSVALMGVFGAQARTVLLGMTLVIISLALLALVAAAARKHQTRVVKVVLTPAHTGWTCTDGSVRSVIDLSRAAPSRAPPVSDLRARLDPLAELPPDDPARP